MPDVQGVYYIHPTTGEAGLWVMIKNDRIVGRSDADMQAFIVSHNITTVEQAQPFIDDIEAYINEGLTDKIQQNTFFAGWTQADEQAWRAAPPEFYSVHGGQIWVQRSVFSLEVLSVNPLRYVSTVRQGASGSVIVPG
jgi:hypothetical protein